MKLERWLDASHLDAATITARRAGFEQDRFRTVVLDRFLLAEKLHALQRVFAAEGCFQDYLGRKASSSRAVLQAGGKPFYEYRVKTAAGWSRVPDESRLAHELVLAGPADRCEGAAGWTTHLEFQQLIATEALSGFLEALTGIRAGPGFTWMPRIMRPGHFVRAHDDTGPRRKLCMIFFVGDGWRPGFGARFQNVEAGQLARSIEPLANRIIIHEPRLDQIHQVEEFAAPAADWERWAYSIWLHGPEA